MFIVYTARVNLERRHLEGLNSKRKTWQENPGDSSKYDVKMVFNRYLEISCQEGTTRIYISIFFCDVLRKNKTNKLWIHYLSLSHAHALADGRSDDMFW